MENTQLTFGQKAVGLSFNPSGDDKVNKVKQLYADIIDLHNDILTGPAIVSEGAARLHRIAIKEAQGSQMWSVKALTWKN